MKLVRSSPSAAHRTIGLCGESGGATEAPALEPVSPTAHAAHSPFSSPGVASSGELIAKSCDRSR